MWRTILPSLRPVMRVSCRSVRKMTNADKTSDLIDEKLTWNKNDIRNEWKTGKSVEFNNFVGQNERTELDTIYSTKSAFEQIEEIESQPQNEPYKLDLSTKIADVYKCRHISGLLKTIAPHVAFASKNYLEEVYEKMIQLGFQGSSENTMSYDEFCEIIKRSSTFKQLLLRTSFLAEEMNEKCLVKIYRLFSLINLDPNNKTVRSVVNGLNKNLNRLDLDEISILFRSFEIYSKNPFFRPEFYLKNTLFKLVNAKMLSGEFERINLESLIFYLNVFSPSKQITDHIIQVLMSSMDRFTFRQTVTLLNKIKRITNPKVDFTELIEKCNSKLFELLMVNPSEQDITIYLQGLHRHLDREQIINKIYDPKLMDVLASLVLKFQQSPIVKNFTFNLIYNFGVSYIFNENLTKLMYDQIVSERQVSKQENFSKFVMFTKFRYPFVNVTKLARILFETDQIDLLLRKYNKLSLNTLSEFVLNDLKDDYLINRFLKASSLSKLQVRTISFKLFRTMSLASVYLSMFSDMDDELKNRCIERFNSILEMYSLTDAKPLIRDTLYRIDSRFQSNAYLSNGLFIDMIAIYDKSTQQLVPMNDGQEEYFHKIDKFPLPENQQLLTFLMRIPLLGQTQQYEYNYNYQLKRVLNQMDIKAIELSKDEFTKLPASNRINFLVDKALDSYRSTN